MNDANDKQLLRVLLLEGKAADEMLLRMMLERPQPGVQFEVVPVNDPANVEACLDSGRFDALLYDMGTLDAAGLAAVERLTAPAGGLPLIVLAADEDPLKAREVMRRGAQDYLIKGQAGQALLTRSITHAVERQRSARLIETSEAKYRSLFEHAADAIILADATTGILIQANPAAAALLDVTKAEIIGKHHSWLHPPELRDEYAELFAGHVHDGYGHTTQGCIRRPDGERVPVEITASLVNLPSGPIMFGNFRDLSERREAERSLQLFRDLVNQSNDAVFVIAPDTANLLDVNIKACELLGYSRSELLTKQATDVNAITQSESAWHSYVAGLRSLESILTESRYRGKDGSTVPVEVSAKLVRHEDGDYIIAAARDISERKAAEAEIAALAKFPEESPNAVLRISTAGIIEYRNPASQALLKQWQVNVNEPMPDRFDRIIAKIQTTKTPQRIEEEYADCAYSLTFAAARGDDYVNVYGLNITEQKKLERQLRQADKMRAIGELAGGIAHDFNNQLAPIMGYAQLIEARLANDPKMVKYAKTIMKSSARAAELTKQLLAFARRAKFQTKPVNIHKLISDVQSLLERSIPKNIRLHTELQAPNCTVQGDPAQLESCLLNIALNSRDAMPDGGDLTFRTRIGHLDRGQCRQLSEDLEPGRYLQLEVSDNGQGIAADVVPHIFDPFFTTKDVGKGTGMGLAAAYGTLKQHAGAIDVESQVGRGTTMRIYLPLVHQDDDATKTQSLGELVHGSGHILIVDDEPDVRQLASDIMQMLGYEVSTAEDGAAAVEKYRQNWQQIDLVVLDMSMPNLNGKDAFLQMQEINPKVRAIVASGFGHGDDMNAALDAGVAALVRKPYRIEEMSRVIGKAITDETTT